MKTELKDDRKIVRFSWDELTNGFEVLFHGLDSIVFHAEKRDIYIQAFNNKYDYIRNKFMKPDVQFLDRHKVAAIIIITSIECGLVESKIPTADHIFIGGELLALSAGLSYMQKSLNDLLAKNNIQKQIDKYILPMALSCDTDYMDVLARNLFYAQREYGKVLNPLDLANTLFLIEYITLLKNDIEPMLLKNQ